MLQTGEFGQPLTGDACWATIGPNSTVDQVFVDGRVLHAGGVVPVLPGAELKPVRGFTPITAHHTPVLELELWCANEQPIASPRKPLILATDPFVYAAGVDATITQRLVVPCSGRRNTRVTCSMSVTSAVASLDVIVEGWMYNKADGAFFASVSTFDGSGLWVKAGRLADGTKAEAYTFYLGGWDSEECADEWVIYTRKPLAGDVTSATIMAETFGELGKGR